MKVYHGSLEIVRHPKILLPNRKLDYGAGFIPQHLRNKQKNGWKGVCLNNMPMPVTSTYMSLTISPCNLKSLLFTVPSKEWAEFVMANRTKRGFTHDYDIVYGPVANDRVYLQFSLYESGAIGVDTLINELKTYKLVDQYLFHTEKALKSLKYIDSITIRK